MSYRENEMVRTYIAGEDLVEGQAKFVALSGADVVIATAGGEAAGVVLTGAPIGGAVSVVYSGTIGVEAGGAVTAGEDAAVGADGLLADAVAGNVIVGKIRQDGVAGQLVAVDVFLGGNIKA